MSPDPHLPQPGPAPTPTPAPTPAPAPTDAALRHALQQQLQSGAAAAADDSHALQARVLAQWRQHHAAAHAPEALALGGSPGLHGSGATLQWGGRRRQPWLLAGLLALGLAVALAAWWWRPDPMLNELMQPDLLSQMALGEL